MFQGSPHLSLDAKGRLSVPSRFRKTLAELCAGQMTFTRHPDGCVLLYPRPIWEKKKQELLALPYGARFFQRIVMGSAVDVDMDASGRLLVPSELRSVCQKRSCLSGWVRILSFGMLKSWSSARSRL